MSHGKVVLAFLSMLAMFGLTFYLLEPAVSPLQASNKLSNRGAIKAFGVGVYSDQSCNSKLSSIDWGVLEPGLSQNVTAYIRNEGNFALGLSLSTDNWNPSNASVYITLKWDYNGQSIDKGTVVKVTFTLDVSTSISGITDFSFDIIIVSSG